ncbi:unnamed protein product (macronuclear) [Paramecium tetraurelia]|uniref:Enkurin domain-containing protein n=1 Tax=Paramecium tetraurelia TaxID=5888 RepID=A0D8T8_PARTE|nr:uncharacterized protein GSPATT00014401001 [Paramecium tetraurelia]CAK79455.1 unnamed protein product [Paramecium tetraurelia]|eukprot:XP_001446852.1 hypothetical protein (macronuclear) [Paramecium tetraurelia strain d4-2]
MNNQFLPHDDDPQLKEERKKLYKIFGKETSLGKELFGLYNAHEKTKINYPKPKQKTQEQLDSEKIKTQKTCPQKTIIEYPKEEPKQRQQYYPIDFVQKRKPEAEIRKEIEKYYEGRKFFRPAVQGQDRKKLIEQLQRVFKYKRGALPKGAELPEINIKNDDAFLKDSETTSNAIKKMHKKDLYFTGLKSDNQSDATTLQGDPQIELEVLFSSIMKEIEERQEFLQEIEHLNEPKLKQRIKDEIIERVAELQKVQDLRRHYCN